MPAPPSKKLRIASPGRLGPLPPAISQPELPSPLLHSDSYRHKAARLPPTSPAMNVAASMMAGVSESQEGITTLYLPKGYVSTASPARSSSIPGSWRSNEATSTLSSPDDHQPMPLPPSLQSLSVVEILDHDDRPTFVVDLADSANFDPGPLHIIFANAALRGAGPVADLVQADTTDPLHSTDFSRFKEWVVSFAKNTESVAGPPMASSMLYGGTIWTCSTIRRRYRFIRGAWSPKDDGRGGGAKAWHREASPVSSHVRARSESRGKPGLGIESPMTAARSDRNLGPVSMPQLQTTFDWTRIPLDSPNLSDHHRFARSIDWSSTPLGPIEHWPPDLRILSNMIMGSPHPAALYWGDDLIVIYNEPYISLAEKLHPSLMGSRYRDGWAAVWDEVRPAFEWAWKNGVAYMKQDDHLFMTRNGFLEETFFDWSISPQVGRDGSVVALYNLAIDNTHRMISERRMFTLREVGEKTSRARTVKSFWSQVQNGLEYNEWDVPFALIYAAVEESESESESESASARWSSPQQPNLPQLALEGSIGVPDGHPIAKRMLDLRTSDEGFAPYIREAMSREPMSHAPVVLSADDGTLPESLCDGLAWRGFGDACRNIVIFPVRPTEAGSTILGFIVLGVNPRRHYDEDYRLFINLLKHQLTTSLASAVLVEAEIKKGQELSKELRQLTQEAKECEHRFARMATFGPVGLFIADSQGRIKYCNDMWWEISGHQAASTLDAWTQSVRDEDRAGVENVWSVLVDEKKPITHEFRFKRSRTMIEDRHVDTWALMSCHLERGDGGRLKSIFGCLTDISHQKWAVEQLLANEAAAKEASRLKSQFLANMSHEIRTPITGVIGMAELLLGLELDEEQREYAESISRSANALLPIINDILDFSKLESGRLDIDEVRFSPSMMVRNVKEMLSFTAEDKRLDFRSDISSGIERDLVVLGDPGRVQQIITNLLANSIKFTDPGGYVRLSILKERDTSDGIEIKFVVEDSGIGIEAGVQEKLFQPFRQGDASTARKFGGTGLGLTICKRLLELMKGRITLESTAGVGTTATVWISFNKPQEQGTGTRGLGHMDALPGHLQSDAPCRSSEAGQMPGMPHSAEILPKSPHNPGRHSRQPSSLSLAPSALVDELPVDERAKLQVLVVEDNPTNHKFAITTIRKLGFQVSAVWNGKEALEYLAAAREGARRMPNIILMDVQMPVIDGYKCTHLLRRHLPYRSFLAEVPIVALTASAIQGDREKCEKAGMDDYMTKPVKRTMLEEMLVRWCLAKTRPAMRGNIGGVGADDDDDFTSTSGAQTQGGGCRETVNGGSGEDKWSGIPDCPHPTEHCMDARTDSDSRESKPTTTPSVSPQQQQQQQQAIIAHNTNSGLPAAQPLEPGPRPDVTNTADTNMYGKRDAADQDEKNVAVNNVVAIDDDGDTVMRLQRSHLHRSNTASMSSSLLPPDLPAGL